MKFELIQFSLIQLKYSILRNSRHSFKNEHYPFRFIVNAPVLGTIRSKVDTTVSALIFFYPPPGLSRSVKSKSKCNTTKMPG